MADRRKSLEAPDPPAGSATSKIRAPATSSFGSALPEERGTHWVLIGIYTAGYAGHAARLRASCRKYGVSHYLREMPKAAYRATLAAKPGFMLEKLKEWRRPVVYVDVDFEVMAYPELFDNPEGVDFMIYNWFADPHNFIKQYHPESLLSSSGVIYWNYSPGAISLLKEWCDMVRVNPTCADDQLLDKVFNEGVYVKRLKTRWLPQPYLRIVPYFPDATPVLNHADEPGTNGPQPIPIGQARYPWSVKRVLRAVARKVRAPVRLLKRIGRTRS